MRIYLNKDFFLSTQNIFLLAILIELLVSCSSIDSVHVFDETQAKQLAKRMY